ncbi:MAG TPA: hypothetical protein VNO23_18835 [Candidatus Binatia bacterium]|nr:hypothetical protein [Candidatus Binatia bacterium]
MTTRRWLLVLLLSSVALRVGLWLVSEPVEHPDTGTYERVAAHLLSGDFTGYEGRRPPGYPAVMALAGLSRPGTFALQMLFGCMIAGLLFYLGLALTGRPGFAALAGMTYNLNLAQLFFEANLLSETTATLAVTAACALLVRVFKATSAGQAVAGLLLLLGAISGFAVLTRPQFAYLPLLAATLVAWAAHRHGRLTPLRVGARATLVLGPSLALVLGWATFNYARVGFFTLSTQAGLALFDHSLAFIELAPDRWAHIRDVAIRHRDARLAAGNGHAASWDALPELLATTGLTLPALSRELERLSVEMFLRHPVRYGIGVAHAWVDFWMAPNYWRLERLRTPALAPWLRAVWSVEQPLLRLANAAFLGLVVGAVLMPGVRRMLRLDPALAALAAAVLLASLTQAAAIWVENARYAIPVQPLVVLCVLVAALRLAESRLRQPVLRSVESRSQESQP